MANFKKVIAERDKSMEKIWQFGFDVHLDVNAFKIEEGEVPKPYYFQQTPGYLVRK